MGVRIRFEIFPGLHGAEFSIITDLHPTTIWLVSETLENTQISEPASEHTISCVKHYDGPVYQDFLQLSIMLNFELSINKGEDTSMAMYGKDEWRYGTFMSEQTKGFHQLLQGKIQALTGGLITPEILQLVDISSPPFYQIGPNIWTVDP